MKYKYKSPYARKNTQFKKAVKRRNIRKGVSSRLARYNKYPAVHNFKEWCQVTDINIDPNVSAGNILTFSANQMTNWANLAGLFDLYKITGVKVKIVPTWNTNQLSNGVLTGGSTDFTKVSQLPMMYIAPNHNPQVPAPTSVADILNDDYCKIFRLTKPVTVYINNPKPNMLSYNTDGGPNGYVIEQFNSTLNQLQPWLTTGGNGQNIDQSAYKHFGFRYFIDNTNAAPATVHVYYKFYIALKEQD